jgi:uncharacterized protein YuzB (UPF0349 family)
MTTREDIIIDLLEAEIVYFCKRCGRPFAGMVEGEIQERKSNGTFEDESDRIVGGHLRMCRRGEGAI